LVNFPNGGQATCTALGAGGFPDWGPFVLTAGANGDSAFVANGLFDSNGDRYTTGVMNLGTDDNGLTCK
jgi:hypothetical protein